MAPADIDLHDASPTRGLRLLVRDHSWVHLVLGIIGNAAFLAGSIMFFWDSTTTAGIWCFVIGATGMLISSVGQALVKSLGG